VFEQLGAERDEPARQIAAARVQAVEDVTGSGARSDS
jgi:hypothetical protein